MSMHPVPWPEPDPQVAAAVRAMYAGTRKRPPLAVTVRDRLGEWMHDEDFAGAFGQRGRPGWPPSRLALVTVFQMAEDLDDRGAAEAVRTRLDWKYALGIGLEDPGFDHSVLSEFRTRAAGHGLEQVVLDRLLERLVADGLVKAGGKQRTDSTHVVAAVAALNRLELVGESVRAALEALAVVHPQWLAQRVCVPDFTRRYGAPMTSWRPPASAARRGELAIAYARDGYALVEACYEESAPAFLRDIPAVSTLRQVLVQNYTRTVGSSGREVIKRRGAESEGGDGLPPGHIRIASPYDTDARWGVKRDTFWLGYKLHISETCDDPPACTCAGHDLTGIPAGTAGAARGGGDRAAAQPPGHDQAGHRRQSGRQDGHRKGCAHLIRPNLITQVATTDATVPDSKMTEPIHDALAARHLPPGRSYLDSGYLSADLVVRSARAGIVLIGPLLADHSAQARAGHGYDRSRFAIDYDARQATCPQGHLSSTWSPVTQGGKDAIVVTFPASICGPCPVRELCTTSKTQRRQLSILPRDLAGAQAVARAAEHDKTWQADYARRAGVEGTMMQAVAACGSRRARYRGLARTRLEHTYSATALNLLRLDAYWNAQPLDRRRTSHLARLDLALAV